MVTSIDWEATVEGNWIPATATTLDLLNTKVKQPHKLYFYPRAIYEITYNRAGHYSQSQLAVLARVLTLAQMRAFHPIEVYVAPEGTKAIPPHLMMKEDFIDAGFRLETIG